VLEKVISRNDGMKERSHRWWVPFSICIFGLAITACYFGLWIPNCPSERVYR